MAAALQRVVCVEDDPDIREIVRIALGDIGQLNVDIYGSGHEALAKAAGFDPDLILLDVMMPEMDGTETFAALRQIEGLLAKPIVFMTAKVQSHEVTSYLGLGAAAVISKPFDPLTLADDVRTIWRRAQGQRVH